MLLPSPDRTGEMLNKLVAVALRTSYFATSDTSHVEHASQQGVENLAEMHIQEWN